MFYPWKLHLAPSNAFLEQILKPGNAIPVISSDNNTHNEWEVLEVVNSWQTKRYEIQYKAIYIGN